MTGRCATCKHWGREQGAVGTGECLMAASYAYGDPVNVSTIAQACVKHDAIEVEAGLFTYDNFGCVMWETGQ